MAGKDGDGDGTDVEKVLQVYHSGRMTQSRIRAALERSNTTAEVQEATWDVVEAEEDEEAATVVVGGVAFSLVARLLSWEHYRVVHRGKLPDMQVEEQWPPVVKSDMEPMSLPIVRPPEPESAGAVFCDEAGDVSIPEDSLFFIQLPTTLPLSKTTISSTNTDGDESMENAEESSDKASNKVKESKEQEESAYVQDPLTNDDGVFDHSISTAPGGFIGKICVHKSGKAVLMIGDKQFEVATAQTPSFCEEVYVVNTSDKNLSILGNVERHLVVTPDFDVLLC
ncbi:hypothetical protein BBJ29_000900 [Phytophthora kernoviae]|uniref:DNA-directed RNA polymerase III subunit RPC4 n=1 Tax=Phytophthora kernoviae TaxID=325452 RepID=A0A3F2RW43_9STRA|nr:hypothetical protein BBJ29_000900 [Phytophthora kernoviae]RLN65412.1 hypothetical protein BBP00_00002876 [Phytophthora kernoviae]